MKKLILIAFLLFSLAITACGRGENRDGLDAPPPVDIRQMPLEIIDVPLRMAVPLGWQSALDAPQSGFTLIPQILGAHGVCVASAFTLTVPQGSAGHWQDVFIDGQPQPMVAAQADGSFLIIPAVLLSHNTLYTFRIVTNQAGDLAWTFQTTPAFALVSTLPAHESVNVPVNTGIELNFSVAGYGDIREYFSIYPPVEGRFIQRGATSIFMPVNPLERGRIYTVTLRAGIGLEGTNERLGQDVSFAFETEDSEFAGLTHSDESFHFSVPYAELPGFEPPQISFWLSYARGARPRVDIEVFRFGDNERAVADIHQFFATPQWAWLSWHTNRIDTANMERVMRMNFNTAQNLDEWGWQETLILNDALPPGFYVVNASIRGELNAQKILQISDLAVHVIADDTQTLVWVNDMISGLPVQHATVRDTTRSGQTNASGIVSLTGGITDANDRLIIEAPDGKRMVLFNALYVQPSGMFRVDRAWWGAPQTSEAYWSVVQLDRTLFQRSDTVYFWGFAQNRAEREEINYITAVLTEGWNWARIGGGAGDTLHRQVVPVERGRFNGEMQLPHLDPNWYVLTIYHGDIVLGTVNFEVQDFVKPPYQLVMSATPRAIFMDQQATFTIRTEFFEGTPVPDLRISYSGWGWPVQFNPSPRSATTNQNGEVNVTVGPFSAQAGAQGQGQINLSAEATLPEIGHTWHQHSIQVFVNDIDVQVRASREGADATLSIEAHHITLDRLNDGTALHSGDFLGQPLVRQNLHVDIVRVYWVATRIGERYCFINRVVVPRYRYDRREQVIQNFTVTTNTQGQAERNFTVPNVDGESYFARVSTTDGNGRRIMHEAFIGRDWWNFWSRAESGEPFLDGARPWGEGYDLNEEVRLTVMSGTEKLERGQFLFVIASGGIVEYRVGVNPLVFTFDEMHLPSATVYAIHFNGHTYRSGWGMRETLHFNHNSRALSFEITTCRPGYRPGETAEITVRVTDESGRPRQAFINLSAVDEAIFALRDFTPRTLADLYRSIPSGVRRQVVTHGTFTSDGNDAVMYMAGGSRQSWGGQNVFRSGLAVAESADMAAMPAPTAAPPGTALAGAEHIREIFEDTALFFSAQTNAQGIATVTLRVPDNLTSWRLTASGITDDLYAGNETANLIVSNPLFVHYSLNDIFLVGDVPILGVNAFGTSLSAGDRVSFEIWQDDPLLTRIYPLRAEGYAFARVNIPLWEMTEEGSDSILIRVTCENGLSDIVRHHFEVVESHRFIDIAYFYEVTAGLQFNPQNMGMTQITFADQGQSQFLQALFAMRFPRGARIEELIMRREANRLIAAHFPDVRLFTAPCTFNAADYQRPNGGLAMLPHAEADLAVTVRVLPFVINEINQTAMRNFLHAAYQDPAQSAVLALYGLALLREPVLLHLHDFTQVQDLSLADTTHLALAFAALGDMQTARSLYTARIAPYIASIAPFYRAEGANRNETLQLTADIALLASRLQMPERAGLHNYVMRNHTGLLPVRMRQLSYISHEIMQVNTTPASITYTLFGEETTRDLSGWNSFTLRIPTQNLHEFAITSVMGDVGAVSTHRVPLAEIESTDADVTITRQFFRAGERTPRTTFNEGDLVRVEITVNYGRTALTGAFQITDFIPAGLVHAPNSARAEQHNSTHRRHIWATAEGRRIQFFDFNSPNNRREERITYFYYARVINAGTFTAEGTVVQNLDAQGYMTVGECVRVVIGG
ncbi:MAG: Ig-like domain-containing protein [Defluviitaleaceae bacterium]|nr:Ig-like domain-containing protein [Defluviitaleaceae bacterium]MCL2274515.1 Ig-like domain-containing protein [Defluviitaleaceae bacterium]